jgi:response regulator RpfG family c-di-GMP phosphodiesterase
MKSKIALVDDEPEILEALRDLLQDDYDVVEFSDSVKFASQFKDISDLRLIITDYNMPGLNGIELMKKVYTDSNSVIPFVIQSGYVDKATALSAIELGVFKILEKPWNPEVLIATINELLIRVDLEKSRLEIQKITQQIQELYQMMRLTFLQYIPQETLDRMVVDAPQGFIKSKMNFEELLFSLEKKLNELLNYEKNLSTNVTKQLIDAAKRKA